MDDSFDYVIRIIPETNTEFMVPASGDSAAYTNFIARTSGLDGTHLAAYAALLNGLTTDGFFDGSGNSTLLDVLYITATQDATTSMLNLVSGSFDGTVVSTPIFTADQGYSDVNGLRYLMSYNSATAGGNYTQNSACAGYWAYNTPLVGARVLEAGTGQNMYPNFDGAGAFYSRINDNPETGAKTAAGAAGFYLGCRTGATTRAEYCNGSAVGSYGSQASQALNNVAWKVFDGGGDATRIYSAAVFGAGLDSTQQGNLYSRLRTYMTAVGVP